MTPRIFAFCLFAVSLWLPSLAIADEIQSEKKTRPANLRVDYEYMEGFGLYANPKDGSLGRDLWDNSRRSVITEMLANLPAPVKSSPTQQRLVMGALLSVANPNLIEDDIRIEPGQDILTLRMKRLNSFGAYKQAFKIYTAIGKEPYTHDLAEAGIIAMLMNGERSLACLEYKTMEARDFQSEFWDNITRYCQFVLAGDNKDVAEAARQRLAEASLPTLRNIAQKSSYKVSYDTANFKKISEVERAILMAEDRVNWPQLSTAFLKKIPLKHLGMIIARTDLSNDQQFIVYAQGAARGLVGPDMISKFYTKVFDEDLRQLDSPGNLGWKSIPYAYVQMQKSRDNDEKWSHILPTYGYMDTYGAAVFSPFAGLMQTLDIDGKNVDQIYDSLRIIKYSGENIPGRWVKYFSEVKNTSKFNRTLYFLAKIWEEKSAEEMAQDPVIQQFLDEHKKKLKLNYFNIIENLDKSDENIHNADEIYVNGHDLTFTESYVMPMPRVWDRLVNSSQHKRIGEAVLLSTAMLRKQALGDHYPDVVSDVLQTLNNVGLTKTSKTLILEMVLEQQ